MSLYLQYLFSGLAAGSIYAMIAIGITLVHYSSGIVNFAHGEMVILGAFLSIALLAWGAPLFVAIVLAILITAIIGVMIERVVIHSMLRGPYGAILMVTVGISFSLKGSEMLVWGKDSLMFPSLLGLNSLNVGEAAISPQILVVLGVLVALALSLWFFFEHNLLGKAMTAAAENDALARLIGLNVERLTMLSFGLSAAVGALAGILVAPIITVSYESGPMFLTKGLAAAVIGGFGNLTGAVVGGLLLGLLEAVASGSISPLFKDAAALSVLILVLWWKPRGILT